jgi:methylglutaconyl-CoA hydratase
MSEAIITTIDDYGVATITLNRPKVHNAFDDTLIKNLGAELSRLEEDLDTSFIILAANGDSFSAGADLNWMQRMAQYSEQENLKDARQLAELMRRLHDFKKPTIAKVQGAAFGGGVGLVACCDIAIASEKASFCLSEVKLGLIPAVISPYVVKAIGERQARRYFITAERFDAREALRIGLVHRVVSPESLDDWVDKLITTLQANGPNAMSACKDLIRTVSRAPIDADMIEDTAQRIAAVRVSDEGQEGLDAFLNKRKPDWCDAVDF